MKKLSLVLTMVLAASFAMAQNTALVEQIGSSNGATVAQTGVLNDAKSHQFGDENGALVKQIGQENKGVADQLDGNKNSGTVDQYGYKNDAELIQGMKPGYFGVVGTQTIATTYMPSNQNIGSIKQNGEMNTGQLWQFGNENNGVVDQKGGNNNQAYVYQGWAGDWWNQPTYIALYSYKSTAVINQIGSNNIDAAIWQYGGTNNYANISETGDGNTARIAQGTIYSDYGYNFSHPVINTQNNSASITQVGNTNKARLYQLGNGNFFTLAQNGNGNKLGLAIGSLLVSRDGYFDQDGNNNVFIGIQTNGAELKNTSRQKGNSNYINMAQGADDFAEIIQAGDLNGTLLTQGGTGQIATVLQTGNSNSATVTQAGF